MGNLFFYLFIYYIRPEMEVYKEIGNNHFLIGKIINEFDCCNMRFYIKTKKARRKTRKAKRKRRKRSKTS